MLDLDGPHRRRRQQSGTWPVWAAVAVMATGLACVVLAVYRGM